MVMATVTTARTRRAVRSFRDALERDPDVSVTDLAAELRSVEPATLVRLRDAAAAAIDEARTDGFDIASLGGPPASSEVRAATLVGEGARREAMAWVLADALTREEAADRLGVTPQAISERLKAGKITAIRRGREWRFPAWQFGDDAVLPGLAKVIGAWPGTALALSAWATRPSVDLDGRAPAQELGRRGGDARVLELVDAVSITAW